MTNTHISVCASDKGGVGKSITALALAAAAAMLVGRQLRVAFADLNASPFATMMGLGTAASDDPLSALPIPFTHPRLNGAELLIFPGGESLYDASEREVADHLARCASAADLLFVDTPPDCRHPVVHAALRAASVIVAPVLPEFQALSGLERILATRDALGVTARVRALLCRWERTTNLAIDVHRELVTSHPGMAISTTIPKDQRAAEAPAAGVPVTLYAPKSPSAVAYRAALYEIASTGGLRLPKEAVR